MEIYDIVRLVNALTASIVFCALFYKGRMYWHTYGAQQRLLYISFTLYAGATAYGSVEAYNLNAPPGARAFIFLAANVVALYAFIRYRNSAFTVPDHPSGSSDG